MKLTNAFVYIMSNKTRTTFYIGVTNDLEKRVKQHQNGLSEFTRKYKLFDLVYYEIISDIVTDIAREKQLKRWHREWKINLIKSMNPDLKNLAEGWHCLSDSF